MIRLSHPRSLARLLPVIMLAYVLALSGLLGSITAGAHVSEARTAAQLGVICTIHGMASGQTDGADPTPGKLACIEHCVLAGAGTMPAALPSNHDARALTPTVMAHVIVVLAPRIQQPITGLPPPRGPPHLI